MNFIDSCFEPILSLSKEIRYGIYTTQSGVKASLRIPQFFEGHAGISHGGVIALIFDEAMGWACVNINNSPAYTQRLKVTYISPIFVGEPYSLEAKVESSEKDKLTVIATIFDISGDVVASATGLFHCIKVEFLNFKIQDLSHQV